MLQSPGKQLVRVRRLVRRKRSITAAPRQSTASSASTSTSSLPAWATADDDAPLVGVGGVAQPASGVDSVDGKQTTSGLTLARCYGMVGHVNSSAPAVQGLFRQRWRDFIVQEVAEDGVVVGATTSGDTTTIPEMSQDVLEGKDYYVECTLRKQNVAHPVALRALAQSLHISPRAIGVCGIKDRKAETYQRITVQGVAPQQLQQANKQLKKKLRLLITKPRIKDTATENIVNTMRLSDFRYVTRPLKAGYHLGNRFQITLRDVQQKADAVDAAVHSLATNGFPNYFGSQRFNWFSSPKTDIGEAVIRGDFIVFAFRFLDFTTRVHTLAELVNRRLLYPLEVQEHYRRALLAELYKRDIEMRHVDGMLSPDKVGHGGGKAYLTEVTADCGPRGGLGGGGGGEIYISGLYRNVNDACREAFSRLPMVSRSMMQRRLPSYLWNVALSIRESQVGLRDVQVGDFVIRQEDRLPGVNKYIEEKLLRVTADNKARYTVGDVVHPEFMCGSFPLPDNEAGRAYQFLCDKHSVSWDRPRLSGVPKAARHIVTIPRDVVHRYRKNDGVLQLDFTLPGGAYATMALRELAKSLKCPGDAGGNDYPRHEREWTVGRIDPSFVDTPDTLDEDSELDTDALETVGSTEYKVDRRAQRVLENRKRWVADNASREARRGDLDRRAEAERIFEPDFAREVTNVQDYIGHTVPLRPNQSRSLRHKINTRRWKYGRSMLNFTAKHVKPKIKLEAMKRGAPKSTFKQLRPGSWNRAPPASPKRDRRRG